MVTTDMEFRRRTGLDGARQAGGPGVGDELGAQHVLVDRVFFMTSGM
jgi:hypothetical protein